MKLLFLKIPFYIIFAMLNIFFAIPLLLFGVVVFSTILLHCSFETALMIAWHLLIAIKLSFIVLLYLVARDCMKFLDRFSSPWKLIRIPLALDLLMFILQVLAVQIYDIIDISNGGAGVAILLVSVIMLGGVTPSYLVFLLFKNHFQINQPAKSDE